MIYNNFKFVIGKILGEKPIYSIFTTFLAVVVSTCVKHCCHSKESNATLQSLTPQFMKTIKDVTKISRSRLENLIGFFVSPHIIKPLRGPAGFEWTVFKVSIAYIPFLQINFNSSANVLGYLSLNGYSGESNSSKVIS